jgi:hypothetical protein
MKIKNEIEKNRRRISYVLTVFLLQNCSSSIAQQADVILEQPYSFIIADGEISRVQQHSDTLQWPHGRLYDAVQTENLAALDWEVSRQYKVWSAYPKDSLWYLALERLDSIPLSIDPLPEDRFSVIALHKGNGQQIGIVQLATGLNTEALDSLLNGAIERKEWFLTTYFCDAKWKELGSLPAIKTKDEAFRIREKLQSDEVKDWLRLYEGNPIKEMYGTGLMTEILNRICLVMGFNPIGVCFTAHQ